MTNFLYFIEVSLGPISSAVLTLLDINQQTDKSNVYIEFLENTTSFFHESVHIFVCSEWGLNYFVIFLILAITERFDVLISKLYPKFLYLKIRFLVVNMNREKVYKTIITLFELDLTFQWFYALCSIWVFTAIFFIYKYI